MLYLRHCYGRKFSFFKVYVFLSWQCSSLRTFCTRNTFQIWTFCRLEKAIIITLVLFMSDLTWLKELASSAEIAAASLIGLECDRFNILVLTGLGATGGRVFTEDDLMIMIVITSCSIVWRDVVLVFLQTGRWKTDIQTNRWIDGQTDRQITVPCYFRWSSQMWLVFLLWSPLPLGSLVSQHGRL